MVFDRRWDRTGHGRTVDGVVQNRLSDQPRLQPKQGGFVGAFLLGLFFGVVSSPCATPVLVVLLTLVASKGEVLYGVALLFCYAIGHCMLMPLAGTFTGFVEGFVNARGVVNFSLWTKRVSGTDSARRRLVCLAGVLSG